MEILIPLLLAPLFYLLILKLLYYRSGMERVLEVETGAFIKASGWGSAKINGVRFKGSAKIESYEKGWIIKAMPLFGGGKLWVPKDGVQIVKEEKNFLVSYTETRIRWSGNLVILYSRLGEVVELPNN